MRTTNFKYMVLYRDKTGEVLVAFLHNTCSKLSALGEKPGKFQTGLVSSHSLSCVEDSFLLWPKQSFQ